MNEIESDTDLLEDIEKLSERMGKKGYLFFPGYLDKNKILYLRKRLIEILKELNWVHPSLDGKMIPKGPLPLFRSPEYDRCIPLIQSIEQLHQFAYDEKLLYLMQRIIQAPVVSHATRVLRIVSPTSIDKDSTTDVHQDYRYVQGTPSTYTAWFPLGDCPKEMGGLKILKGSHQGGIKPVLGLGKSKCGVVDIPDDHPDWVLASYKTGDVLIFHSFTIHGASPNQSDSLRLSADFRYQSVNEPICQRALQPFGYPEISGWESLTKDWTTLQWIQVPSTMNIVPYSKVIQNENSLNSKAFHCLEEKIEEQSHVEVQNAAYINDG